MWNEFGYGPAVPQLTFADLINRRVPLAAHEAAGLTLAVARLMDVQRSSGQRVQLPDDEWILLSSNGDVSMVEVHAAAVGDETERLSALLRRLLHLDDRDTSPNPGIVPGGLLIVLARNLGYIHLPATGPVAFRAALERFGSSDPSLLAAVFWRAASGRPELLPRHVRGSRAARKPDRVERRQRGPSVPDMRRALREIECELFQLRERCQAMAAARRPAADVRRVAVAALLAVSFTGALAVAALALTGGERESPPPEAFHMAVDSEPQMVDVERQRAVPVAAIGMQPVTLRSVAVGPIEPAAATPETPHAIVNVKATRVRRARPPQPSAERRPQQAVSKRADPLKAQRGGTRGMPF